MRTVWGKKTPNKCQNKCLLKPHLIFIPTPIERPTNRRAWRTQPRLPVAANGLVSCLFMLCSIFRSRELFNCAPKRPEHGSADQLDRFIYQGVDRTANRWSECCECDPDRDMIVSFPANAHSRPGGPSRPEESVRGHGSPWTVVAMARLGPTIVELWTHLRYGSSVLFCEILFPSSFFFTSGLFL